jgi:glycosyltransferase involved in cell wall biosynthesis
MPRLSVQMPARNAVRTLSRAISSTLRAMPDDAELLIFDDASDNGTSVVLDLRQVRRKVHAAALPGRVGASPSQTATS